MSEHNIMLVSDPYDKPADLAIGPRWECGCLKYLNEGETPNFYREVLVVESCPAHGNGMRLKAVLKSYFSAEDKNWKEVAREAENKLKQVHESRQRWKTAFFQKREEEKQREIDQERLDKLEQLWIWLRDGKKTKRHIHNYERAKTYAKEIGLE